MTLKEFNELVVPILNLAVTCSGIATIVIMVRQYRSDARWNRLQSKYNFIDVAESAAIQERLNLVLETVDGYVYPEVCQPLTQAQVNQIASARESTFVVNTFLNDMNNVCTALKFGLLDERVFKSSHAGRILWWYKVLLPYIESARVRYHNAEIWQDFVETAQKYAQWAPLSVNRDQTSRA